MEFCNMIEVRMFVIFLFLLYAIDYYFIIQFNKDSGRNVEECKLRVVYISPHSSPGHSEDAFKQSSDGNSVSSEFSS